MIKRTLSVAAVLSLFASPAFAGHCPTDVAKIDAALAADPAISDEERAKVMELRNKGESLHNSGDHGESIAELHQALEILGIPD